MNFYLGYITAQNQRIRFTHNWASFPRPNSWKNTDNKLAGNLFPILITLNTNEIKDQRVHKQPIGGEEEGSAK